MVKIFLLGRRSHRTPFSYPEYQRLFQQHFQYVQNPESADFLVFSFILDLSENIDEVNRIRTVNPDVRLVVISEEPLWDTIWSGDFLPRQTSISLGDTEHSYSILNHFGTRIYDFEKIPYFITTSDDYFARYSYLFSRNSTLKQGDLKSAWEKLAIRVAFYAERRAEANLDVRFPERDITGLCRYRTLVAEAVTGDGVLRVGQGWGNSIKRQLLPDWHLDKLAVLDRRAFIVSGIENTHQWNYVTEKIFDAFAVLAVPVYYASPSHGVMRLVPPGSYINLYGLTADQAAEQIARFEPDPDFIDSYREAQSRLAAMFSNPTQLTTERRRVVSEIVKEFQALS